MSDLTFYTDIKERTISLLYSQFKQHQNWQDFVGVITKQIQELENMWQQMYLVRSLDTAFGAQLDHVGEIIGLERGTLYDDEEYRDALKFQIELNKSAGETEFIISALKRLTKASRIVFIENYPAAIILFSNGEYENIPSDIKQKMDDLALGGVAILVVTVTPESIGEPFRYDTFIEGTDYGLGYGWADTSGNIVYDGGYYGWAYQ